MSRMEAEIELGLKVAKDQRDIVQLLRGKSLFLANSGKLEEGLSIISEAIERARAIGDTAMLIAALTVKAYLLEALNKPTEALEIYEQSLLLCDSIKSGNRAMPVVDRLISNYIKDGRIREAQALAEQYIATYEHSYPLGVVVNARYASLLSATGDFDGAIEVGRNAFDRSMGMELYTTADIALSHYFFINLTPTSDVFRDFDRLIARIDLDKAESNYFIGNFQLYRAYREFFDKNYGRADELAQLALESYKIKDKDRDDFRVAFLRLLIKMQKSELVQDDATMLLELLEKDLRTDGVIGNSIALSDSFPELPKMLAELTPNPKQYIRRYNEILTPRQANPIKISLTTLGNNRIKLNNKDMRISHITAFESLVYIAIMGPSTQDIIAESVWPESDLQKARSSAQQSKSTINKQFRSALSDLSIPLVNLFEAGNLSERRGRNPLWEFSSQVSVEIDAVNILHENNPQRVKKLYKGVFLAGIDHEWVEYYRKTIERHVSKVYYEAGRLEKNIQARLHWFIEAAAVSYDPAIIEEIGSVFLEIGDSKRAREVDIILESISNGDLPALTTLLN